MVEIKELLVGQSVDADTRREMRMFLHEQEEIEHVYDMITLQQGETAVAMIRARMTEKENAEKLLFDINEVERRLHERFPIFEDIFFEPDNNAEAM